MAALELPELDSLTITVIVDNELDPISPSPNPAVVQSGGLRTVGITGPLLTSDTTRPGSLRELRMDHICCGAHGLSLLITGTHNGGKHSILFDTGPEGHVWERNATRLGLLHGEGGIGAVEDVVLSHWHRDHSGGMEKAVSMIQAAKGDGGEQVRADLHPERPMYRGLQPPGMPGVVSLEPDPTFEEIEAAGAKIVKSAEPHLVGGGLFCVSGEIPRETEYERGLLFGMRINEGKGSWEKDELMRDERFVVCRVKGKGLVMFTGCSHAGVVNASRHAITLGNKDPLYAVMGGFHLADAEADTISATARDLKALEAKVLLTGHCTGWRAKFELQKVFDDGALVPSFVGSKFDL